MTLSEEQSAELFKLLSNCRHNVNNNLSLIISAAELLQLKPDTAERMARTIIDQTKKITEEITSYSGSVERIYHEGAKSS